MAHIFEEPSRTFSEYLLVPGYSSKECRVDNVSLKTPVVKFRKGEEPELTMNIPLVSAIMQAVSGDELAIALAKEGGISFIYGSQSIESQAAMVRKVKSHKAGFVTSDANIRPDQTLRELLELKERTGHSTTAVTEDGTAEGRMVGLVTSRDYRISRMSLDEKVCNFMTPFEKLVYAEEGVTLSEANDILWEHKLNALPIVDKDQRLTAFVFRKDYNSHKEYPDELLDEHKRYVVGAGINTRDYAERVPALVEAGADVLCIDSSEGYSEWQKMTLDFIREKYGDTVKVGAGNVVDRDGFNYLADAGADFIKTSTGKVDVNATPAAAYVMCECIAKFYAKTGRKVGFKAAGGISTVGDAVSYYSIVSAILGKEWLNKDLFRFGVSRLANSLLSAIEQKTVVFF